MHRNDRGLSKDTIHVSLSARLLVVMNLVAIDVQVGYLLTHSFNTVKIPRSIDSIVINVIVVNMKTIIVNIVI